MSLAVTELVGSGVGGELLYAEFSTPVGVLAVVTDPTDVGDRRIDPKAGAGRVGAVVASGFVPLAQLLTELPGQVSDRPTAADPLAPIAALLDRYFDGDIDALDEVSVSQRGGAFTESAWSALREVPAGAVVSYTELATSVGRPRAARAAGTACATNHVAPFVPCHRVVKSGGSLGNYGYGTQVKAALLKHERALDGR
ncbi:MAG TPA: methylated-DNA--[protein]-cysteine S-methyltransferase [Actinomycetota bacterium]|nr:methylated-DNA--[protein]-cysteine S-methyltransferase [Actinomycetota bacterium]